MNSHFYLLKASFYKIVNCKKESWVVTERFTHEQLQVARMKALQKFESYIEVLLEFKQKKYRSHDEAISDLRDFIYSGTTEVSNVSGQLVNSDLNRGLFLYMINSNSKMYTASSGELIHADRKLVHYIGMQQDDLIEYVINALLYEYNLYVNCNYERNLHPEALVYDQLRGSRKILQTPLFELKAS